MKLISTYNAAQLLSYFAQFSVKQAPQASFNSQMICLNSAMEPLSKRDLRYPEQSNSLTFLTLARPIVHFLPKFLSLF